MARSNRPRARRALLATLAVLLGVAAPAAAEDRPAAPQEPSSPERTGRAIVLLEDGVSTSLVASRYGLRRAGRQPARLDALTVALAGRTITELRRRLLADRGVVAVEPEYRRFLRAPARAPRLRPDDPAFAAPDPEAPGGAPGQWNLIRQGFEAAWDVSRGIGVRVAIVDTGLDAGHPDFSGRIDALVDQDPTPLAGGAGVDETGHGTHVSGLACGIGNNGFGIAGAGLGCAVIVEKTDLSDASIATSIVDAVNRGAKVINLSLGGPGEASIIRRAIDFAIERDVVLVAAAANEETEDQGIPAQYLQAPGTGADLSVNRGLVVTSADFDDRRVEEAGFGTGVSLAAYGDTNPDTPGILSTWPGNLTSIETGSLLPPGLPCLCRTEVGGDDRFAYLFGTSMASPQVAGLAALIRSLNPKASAARVIRAIKEGARGTAFSQDLGWGIIDAAATMGLALRLETDPPTSRARSTRRVRSRIFTVTVTARDPVVDRVPATGLERVDVYGARSGAGYRRIRRIPASSFSGGRFRFRYRGVPGRTYRFYTRARDVVGNEEATPSRADTRTQIVRRSRR